MFYTLLFIVVIITIFYVRRKYTYWERKGVPAPKPWPFFGNIFESFTKKRTAGQIFMDIYSKYDEYPLVGAYRTDEPILIVRDLEFINRILVKDARSFFNNDFYVDRKIDPLQGSNPVLQKDGEWRETRTLLSPGFTSGKMKSLFTLLEQVNVRLSKYLDSRPDIAKGLTIETQNLCRRYTLDNVALAAFGIEGKCFDSEESEFMNLANSYIAPGTFALSMWQTFPVLSNLISFKIIPKDVEDRLLKIVADILDYRKSKKIFVNDYLQYIMEFEEKKGMNYTEIAGHATTFFEDGYETSALVMSRVLMNLALHPQAQEKIRSEINLFEENNPTKKITYDNLAEMSYLNACINESMRLYPVLDYYNRVCNDPYIYETSPEAPEHLKRMTVKIDKGTVCMIPFAGLCHDKRYFSEPESFKPERFLDKENNGFKGVFYPFGGGHRVCLGQRFGLMQVRMGLIEIIKKFEVTYSDKTKLPFEFRPWTILNKVKQGIWLTYRKL